MKQLYLSLIFKKIGESVKIYFSFEIKKNLQIELVMTYFTMLSPKFLEILWKGSFKSYLQVDRE